MWRWGCLASLGLALLVAACSLPREEQLISQGIGTELPADDIADSTRNLENYLWYLCDQAGMTSHLGYGESSRATCNMKPFGGRAWNLVVKAGFNDIDRRCDSYLAWLNSRRRNRTAIQQQITDTRNFTEAALFTSGVGAVPLTIVGLAFGLASNTFNNYYSRLILEIEKSTVEVLVREKRLKYREELNVQITSQPDAVHVLREYLLICTPHYIENIINQRTRDSISGNTPADKRNPDQIRKSIRAPKARDKAGTKPDRRIPDHPEFAEFIEGYTKNEFPLSTVKRLQNALCVPTGEVGKVGATTKDYIGIFEHTDLREAADNEEVTKDRKIDVKERDVLRKWENCPRKTVKNFYERVTFADGTAANFKERVKTYVIDRLNKARELTHLDDLPPNTTLAKARERIKVVRATLLATPDLGKLLKHPDRAKKLRQLPEEMRDQWTRDLYDVLGDMR